MEHRHTEESLTKNDPTKTRTCRYLIHMPFLLGHGAFPRERGGGGVTSLLMGMCGWMGPHFDDWIDYNGIVSSIELLEWGRKFSGKIVFHIYG